MKTVRIFCWKGQRKDINGTEHTRLRHLETFIAGTSITVFAQISRHRGEFEDFLKENWSSVGRALGFDPRSNPRASPRLLQLFLTWNPESEQPESSENIVILVSAALFRSKGSSFPSLAFNAPNLPREESFKLRPRWRGELSSLTIIEYKFKGWEKRKKKHWGK